MIMPRNIVKMFQIYIKSLDFKHHMHFTLHLSFHLL